MPSGLHYYTNDDFFSSLLGVMCQVVFHSSFMGACAVPRLKEGHTLSRLRDWPANTYWHFDDGACAIVPRR